MEGYKVLLSAPGGVVIFEASSPVTESRSANYEGFNIVHLPTDLWAYRNTSGRKFSISGKLVSRTPEEASQNAKYLDLVRSWLLPDFGGSGATPPIIRFYAYKNNNINGVYTIMRSYSMTFPDDVDYIYSGGIPMPVICMLGIELDEAYSARQITNKAWKMNVSGKELKSTISGNAEGYEGLFMDLPENFEGFAVEDLTDEQSEIAGKMLDDQFAANAIDNPINTESFSGNMAGLSGNVKDTLSSGISAAKEKISLSGAAASGFNISDIPLAIPAGIANINVNEIIDNFASVTARFTGAIPIPNAPTDVS